MFNRARLRIALLYASLTGLLLVLVGTTITLIAVHEAQRRDDAELAKRAEGLALFARQAGVPAARAIALPEPIVFSSQNVLEHHGIQAFILPVRDGAPVYDTTAKLPVPGIPNQKAARAAVIAARGEALTLSLPPGAVRMFSLPVVKDDKMIAVVQVARPQSFVERSIHRMIGITLLVGAAGMVCSTVAGYWLAGRTLRPIARALEQQRAFTADASHELRTPLALIRGNAEVLSLQAEGLKEDERAMVGDIVQESDRLARLVTDLLTLARADDGRLQLAWADTDLSALCCAVVRQFAPAAAEQGVQLVATPGGRVRVWGDADRLREVLIILVDNAIRCTSAGTVTVHAGYRGHGAILRVTDTGSGIAAEHLDRLFDRFYRVDSARTAASGGAGLGLAIARTIAEAHGGEIRAASTPGKGSRFTVHLPRQAARAKG